ncbi:MAG: flagellar M-ring protein FliF [Bryobacteraceae bacterium]|nr:flagellar M-ring protein FliF [Bryobacteraceae bacterium]
MNQLQRLIQRLSWRQRILIVAAALGALAAITGLSRWNRERDFAPLFSGLSSEDAGLLVARLKESGIEYRLSDSGGAIRVPSALVAETRLQMAAAGIPRSGRIGFELFDKATFGATEFTEQVNFHRAIEGELERSIMSLGDVEHARVHITLARDSLFTDDRRPAKASVLVKLRPGTKLAAANVQAICHLTASAVTGLAPEMISVLDTNGTLLSRPRRAASNEEDAAEASLDHQKKVERELVHKVQATLEPLLGDRFRVGASAEIDLTSGEQSEEVFDPARSVMVNSQRTEDAPAAAAPSGVPGTPSNLPRPAARPGSGASGFVRRTESISYQSSRNVKRTKVPQGVLKRVSLAVLVDHDVRWTGAGAAARRVVEPPAPDKLKVIREVAAAAAGIQPERGDQLVVEAFPFEGTSDRETPPRQDAPAPPPPAATWLPPWLSLEGDSRRVAILAAAGAVAALALLAGAFLLLRQRRRGIHVAETGKTLEGAGPAKHRTPADVEAELNQKLLDHQKEAALQAAEQLAALKLPGPTKRAEVITRHIVDEVRKDPQAMAQVVRSWLSGQDR